MRKSLSALILIPLLMLACGDARSPQQQFIDNFTEIVQENFDRAEIEQQGRTATFAYNNSGYSDLDQLDKAMLAYSSASQLEQHTIKRLAQLRAPDEEAAKIIANFRYGVSKLDESHANFLDRYSQARHQDPEQRAKTATDHNAVLELILEGKASEAMALELLITYATRHSALLDENVQKWQNKLNRERDHAIKLIMREVK